MAIVPQMQFHVLAVDDSSLDRKLIERLLKTSSYQGKFISCTKT
jgi:two-component response regulator ARR-A family